MLKNSIPHQSGESGKRERVKERSRKRFVLSLVISLLHLFLSSATLLAQSDVVYLSGDAGLNPYPGLGTVPSEIDTEFPTTVLYPENSDGATFGLPTAPTQRTSNIFLTGEQAPRRDGMFQKANFDVLWAPTGKGTNAVGMTQLSLSATFGLPAPSKESPLVLTPSFRTWFFDNPEHKFTFHTAGVNIQWFVPIVKNKFMLALGTSPTYSGDFKAKKETFRIPTHLVGIWSCNPRTKILFGVLYTDRSTSYNWLPMGGIIWTPNEDISFELTFPRIRLSQRIKWWGAVAGDSVSDWLYTGFEFSGGSWGYRREGDTDTRFEYSDYRLLLGYERRCLSGLTLALEIGGMFDREINVDGYVKRRPDNAFFLQLKTSY